GEYLKSVLPAEMPPSWHREANRAQAVAARTYAMWDRDVNKNSTWYDTCDTTQCQVYRGAADYNAAGVRTAVHEHASSTAAVDATAGRYLRYSGEPAFTQFSASNGGYSVAGSRPYLKASADPYDGYPQWTETLTAKRIETAYPAIGGF